MDSACWTASWKAWALYVAPETLFTWALCLETTWPGSEEIRETGYSVDEPVIATLEMRPPWTVTETLIPRPCMHCDDPACIKVCPVQATYKTEEGVVLIDYERCIGCRFCTVACPFQVRYFNWFAPEWPEALKAHLNPDPEVAPRPKGVVEKCTFCVQRLRKARETAEAEGRPFVATDYVPACVETCTGHARYFGDLDDPHSLVSQLAASPRAFRLQEEMGTKPKVYYLKEG